ncbi:MAG: FtsQ-type POTRA domain-containing protein, partial [Anaerolineae bacterium]|nr:FtsQ-type POTRA domain-containing protein [Anaerolineae bacterium]
MRPDSDPPAHKKRAERQPPAVRPAQRNRQGRASGPTGRRARLLRLPERQPQGQDNQPKGQRLKQLPQDRQARRINWRYVSGSILVVVVVLTIIVFVSPIFYVTRIEVGGLRYVPPDEVFRLSEAANTHILWVNPQGVKARIEESPGFDSVDVYVRWPARLQVVVREREPALIWEQGGNRYWVDVRGHLMPARRDLPGLVRVINEEDSI